MNVAQKSTSRAQYDLAHSVALAMGHFDGLEAHPRRSLYTSMSVVVAVAASPEESSENRACDAGRGREPVASPMMR